MVYCLWRFKQVKFLRSFQGCLKRNTPRRIQARKFEKFPLRKGGTLIFRNSENGVPKTESFQFNFFESELSCIAFCEQESNEKQKREMRD